jgi:hypothetical protein
MKAPPSMQRLSITYEQHQSITATSKKYAKYAITSSPNK